MIFLLRFKGYFLVGVVCQTEGFFDVIRRSSQVFGEPGFNDGWDDVLLHELRWLFVFLTIFHILGHLIEGILPLNVDTHQAGSVWLLLDLFGDSHKIICGVFGQVGGDHFLFVGGVLGFPVDSGRGQTRGSGSLPDWSQVFNKFRTDELELWTWPWHVFLHESPLPVRTTLHHPWLIHLGASRWFKVSISHIFGHVLDFLFVLSRNITLVNVIILGPGLVEIFQSLNEFAPSDPNHFALGVSHRVVSVILWKIKVTYVFVHEISALHQPTPIILIRKLNLWLFDTDLTYWRALAWNVPFQRVSVHPCAVNLFTCAVNWFILLD